MARTEDTWLPIIGRALAYLCLKTDAGEARSMQERASFLEGLGLSRNDAAAMLGTSAASISVLHGRAKAKKSRGAKRGSKNSKVTRRK